MNVLHHNSLCTSKDYLLGGGIEMELINTDGNDKRFVNLCHELDDFLNEIIGGEKQSEKYNQYYNLKDIHDVILVIDNGQAVGCGSFKKYDEKVAEIKRVFIKKELIFFVLSHMDKGQKVVFSSLLRFYLIRV